MTTKICGKRKHTPITSEAQQGFMGSELRRRREGKKSRIPSMKTKDLVSHLRESKGKNLPERSILKKKGVELSKFAS